MIVAIIIAVVSIAALTYLWGMAYMQNARLRRDLADAHATELVLNTKLDYESALKDYWKGIAIKRGEQVGEGHDENRKLYERFIAIMSPVMVTPRPDGTYAVEHDDPPSIAENDRAAMAERRAARERVPLRIDDPTAIPIPRLDADSDDDDDSDDENAEDDEG